jgi:hypothetical protein
MALLRSSPPLRGSQGSLPIGDISHMVLGVLGRVEQANLGSNSPQIARLWLSL